MNYDQFCKRCKHYYFNLQNGILCGLTQSKPAFSETCKDFVIALVENKNLTSELKRSSLDEEEPSFDVGYDNIIKSNRKINEIIERLKKRKLKPLTKYTWSAFFAVLILGIIFMLVTSYLVYLGSTEEFVSGAVEESIKMTKEKGFLSAIIRIAGYFSVMISPLYTIILPAIWIFILVSISGILFSFTADFTNFRNTKILKVLIITQGIISGIFFDILYFTDTIDKSWMFWIVLIVSPFAFVLFYLKAAFSIISLLYYCSLCGGKLKYKQEITISDESESIFLEMLDSLSEELINKITFIDPQKSKSYIKCTLNSCANEDEGDRVIIVLKVKKDEFESPIYESWFESILPFQFARALISRKYEMKLGK